MFTATANESIDIVQVSKQAKARATKSCGEGGEVER
jgi:hypothetical protein